MASERAKKQLLAKGKLTAGPTSRKGIGLVSPRLLLTMLPR